MRTIERRLAKLEAARPATEGPDVILLVGVSRGPDGELVKDTHAAWLVGGGSLTREEGESEAEFIARAHAVALGLDPAELPRTDAGRIDAAACTDGQLRELLRARRALDETRRGALRANWEKH